MIITFVVIFLTLNTAKHYVEHVRLYPASLTGGKGAHYAGVYSQAPDVLATFLTLK